jgi:hypothetical protein
MTSSIPTSPSNSSNGSIGSWTVSTLARERRWLFVHAEAEAADDDPRYRAFLLEFPKAMGLRDEE